MNTKKRTISGKENFIPILYLQIRTFSILCKIDIFQSNGAIIYRANLFEKKYTIKQAFTLIVEESYCIAVVAKKISTIPE